MNFAENRILKELKEFEKDLPAWIQLDKSELLNIKLIILLNEGPHLNSGQASFEIKIPIDYPFSPPKVFLTGPAEVQSSNPCIDPETGAVCLDILRLEWLPSMTLANVVFGVGLILTDPIGSLDLKEGEEPVVLNQTALKHLLFANANK
jgi:ubiquitin-protein ligase